MHVDSTASKNSLAFHVHWSEVIVGDLAHTAYGEEKKVNGSADIPAVFIIVFFFSGVMGEAMVASSAVSLAHQVYINPLLPATHQGVSKAASI